MLWKKQKTLHLLYPRNFLDLVHLVVLLRFWQLGLRPQALVSDVNLSLVPPRKYSQFRAGMLDDESSSAYLSSSKVVVWNLAHLICRLFEFHQAVISILSKDVTRVRVQISAPVVCN